jgi:hypothetical protein
MSGIVGERMMKGPGSAQQVEQMIDIDAVIRHFGPEAVSSLLSWEAKDNKALRAVSIKSTPNRAEEVLRWLHYYGVFQGIPGPKRSEIAAAVLRWADSRDEQKSLATVDAICQAHESLMAECVEAYGKNRDFTSLASKALWLCFPEDVPLFDSFARRTLWVVSKLDGGAIPTAAGSSEYRQLAHIWKALYARHAATIAEIEMHGYPYRVRVLDVILWIIGSPGYEALPE